MGVCCVPAGHEARGGNALAAPCHERKGSYPVFTARHNLSFLMWGQLRIGDRCKRYAGDIGRCGRI
eukprot:1113012-Amorphochlora_amoeboformis.AAC.1